jgi:hypothetical protein
MLSEVKVGLTPMTLTPYLSQNYKIITQDDGWVWLSEDLYILDDDMLDISMTGYYSKVVRLITDRRLYHLLPLIRPMDYELRGE